VHRLTNRFATFRNNVASLVFLAACFVLMSFTSGRADTIYLKNGTVIHGSIIAQDSNEVKLKNSSGESIVEKSTIRRLAYDDKIEDDAEDRAKKAEEERKKAEEEKKKKDEISQLKQEIEKCKADMKRQEEAKRTVAAQAGWPAIWRSLVLPGWGQYYRGDSTRGKIMMGGSGFLWLYWYKTTREYTQSKNDYNSMAQLAFLTGASGNGSVIGTGYLLANNSRNTFQRTAAKANFVTAFLLAWYIGGALDALMYGRERSAQTAQASITTTTSFLPPDFNRKVPEPEANVSFSFSF